MTLPIEYRPPVMPATDVYVELDGWASPATDADGTVWLCTDVAGWNGSPAPRLSTEDRPEDHGQFDGPSFYGARTITITGTAFCMSRAAAMKAMDTISSVAAWDSGALYPLNVTEPGRPMRQCLVRLDNATKVSPVYAGYQFDWQLQLRAPDPLRYASAETAVSLVLPPPDGADGLVLPFSLPTYIPWLTASATEADVYNVGTFPTRRIVAIFTGPVTTPTLTNGTSGFSLSFNIELGDTDSLVCDFKARTALLNGTDPREYTLAASANWWPLLPGASSIIFGGIGGPGSGVEFRFLSAWL